MLLSCAWRGHGRKHGIANSIAIPSVLEFDAAVYLQIMLFGHLRNAMIHYHPLSVPPSFPDVKAGNCSNAVPTLANTYYCYY